MAKIPAVLIFGAPGSGKGTVGAKLAATTSLKHISTGDIFRGIAPSSESGKLLASYSSKGLLVPDEATVEIFGRFIEAILNIGSFGFCSNKILLYFQQPSVTPACVVSHYVLIARTVCPTIVLIVQVP